MSRGYSLRWRLLLAATLVLLVFMVVTGWALDRAYRHSERLSLQERLETRIYALMATADLDARGQLEMPAALTDARFNLPGSGRYAQISSAGTLLWRSPSLLFELPLPTATQPGRMRFERRHWQQRDLFLTRFSVSWEYAPGQERLLTFQVAEEAGLFLDRVTAFRYQLLFWLGIASLLLLLVQGLMLYWALRPLVRVAQDLGQIRSGKRARMPAGYPRELAPLTDSVNALLASQQQQRDRYRHALADLAHSLKTPLAVMQSGLQDGDSAALSAVTREQTARMRATVDYHLQRAATAGQGVLRQSITLRPQLQRLADSLQKVYSQRNIDLQLQVEAQLCWPVDNGDLLELSGNLLDNAMKWSRSRVRVSSEERNGKACLVIEDDGPGIKPAEVDTILTRGGRGDPSRPGQGIGLAVVQDILAAYAGELRIEVSAWQGARFVACFDFSGRWAGGDSDKSAGP